MSFKTYTTRHGATRAVRERGSGQIIRLMDGGENDIWIVCPPDGIEIYRFIGPRAENYAGRITDSEITLNHGD